MRGQVGGAESIQGLPDLGRGIAVDIHAVDPHPREEALGST